MSSFNKVILLGRLTRDPELRVTTSGVHVCKFALAVSRKYKASDGQLKEEATFVDIDAYGKQAEVISKYFTKGKPIFVEGRLKLDQWESNGEKKSKLHVVLEAFQFIGTSGSAAQDSSDDSSEGAHEYSAPVRSTSASQSSSVEDKFLDDDVPF